MGSDAGRVCTIVGVGPGLGLALARRFGHGGFNLALVARDQNSLDRFTDELNGEGFWTESYRADAGDSQELAGVFKEIKERQGAAGVLIYNAAVLKNGAGSELEPETFLDELKVNVVGALTSVRGVIDDMRSKQKGTIIFTGGGLALNPSAQYASLSSGKAGLRALAFSLAAELEPQGIHVATVTIGGIVRPNSRFAPERIAEVFWNLHSQPKGGFEKEIIYKGI